MKKVAACIVCGASPTINCHTLPRAFIHIVRKGSKHAISGSMDRKGVKYDQSGHSDPELLCRHHEEVIGAGDDYAVRLVRDRIPGGKPHGNEGALEVENAKPDLLMHFIYASIWRYANSRNGRAMGRPLGPYSDILLKALLNGGPYDLEAIVGIQPFHVGKGKMEAPVIIYPWATKMMDMNIWKFVALDVDFILKTDKRPFPSQFRPYLANGNNPLIAIKSESQNLSALPIIRPLARNMRDGRGRKPWGL